MFLMSATERPFDGIEPGFDSYELELSSSHFASIRKFCRLVTELALSAYVCAGAPFAKARCDSVRGEVNNEQAYSSWRGLRRSICCSDNLDCGLGCDDRGRSRVTSFSSLRFSGRSLYRRSHRS